MSGGRAREEERVKDEREGRDEERKDRRGREAREIGGRDR